MQFNRRCLVVVVVAIMAGQGALASVKYKVKVESNVAMQTRDGVTLQADIYRPEAEGKFPVILERTPYDKRNEVNFGISAASRGYVIIVQDVRGRYASDGVWYPFKYESNDGYDAVEWAAALHYSNGKVGMYGGSYDGATQMLTAIATPPHLAGIMPFITASDYHEQWAYQGGAFSQLFNQVWSSELSVNVLTHRTEKYIESQNYSRLQSPGSYTLFDPGSSAGLAEYYYDWISHPLYDDYWKYWSIEQHYSQIKVPALTIGGWYDIFQDGSLRNYLGMMNKGGSEAARKGQRLMMVVGGHAGSDPKIGDVEFGKDSVIDLSELALRWYDYLLKGIANGMASQKPVRLFVMGKNIWRDENEWPLARAKATPYYLHSGGRANTLGGDGTLSATAPGDEAADRYMYDPDHPVPTHGGAVLGDTDHFPPGPLDQRAVETRPDVLVYTTAAFEKDTEVTGPITLQLYVSSSAVDTDFVGKLIDVWPNGFAQNLTDGILRARYRTSMEKADLMNPGEIYKLTINLESTSNVFLAGHKLRLEIESSNYPRFDRNLNTGLNPEASSDSVIATNVIYHDNKRASVLIVPIVP